MILLMRKYYRYISLILLLFLHSGYILLFTGCGFNNKLSASKILPSQEVRIHSVNYQHENLWMIAKWYTGEGKNWYRVKEYNGQLQANGKLLIGDQIRIPTDIMIRLDPMTPEFVVEQVVRIKNARKVRKISADKNFKNEPPSTVDEVIDENAIPDESEEFEIGTENGYETSTQDQLIENLLGK